MMEQESSEHLSDLISPPFALGGVTCMRGQGTSNLQPEEVTVTRHMACSENVLYYRHLRLSGWTEEDWGLSVCPILHADII